ncbi:hypothetical protein OHJ16_15685 [Actinomyces israelii]|mgnify:FL=1|uniref:Uncharacterized protein n=1 Tax=Actinomyces israelii TaxID=1659 RepID=A0ABT4IDQ9_9ACTO|nr:hypothetical protein [Actinomyces israelii]MCZ0859474.1 hypothetical protein [Actinomyces israelii]
MTDEVPWLGPVEWCTVIEHHPWGLDVRTDDSNIIGVIDLRFINDNIMYINPEYWPPVGARLKVRQQVIMPNGQIRYTAREIDLALPATRQEWLDSPAGRAWLASKNGKPEPT